MENYSQGDNNENDKDNTILINNDEDEHKRIRVVSTIKQSVQV
jgi:hypothetical protein